MSEISIKTDELSLRIEELKALQSKWNDKKSFKNMSDVCSGGISANQMEILLETYKSVYEALLILMDNTILFFENMKNSYVDNDAYAAEQFLGDS